MRDSEEDEYFVSKDSLEGYTMESGTIVGKSLTRELELMDEDMYQVHKISLWAKLIKEGMRPIKWDKSEWDGTKVDFEIMKTEEDVKIAVDELMSVSKEHNQKYKLKSKVGI